MGTRADFYVGRGTDAEWLGSIAWDGYPSGIVDPVLHATDEAEYRQAVEMFLDSREDKTLPADGWPWPWDDSNTTDYAYAFDGSAVHASCFGGNWFDPSIDTDGEDPEYSDVAAAFPNMKDRKNVARGNRSGVIMITSRGVE